MGIVCIKCRAPRSDDVCFHDGDGITYNFSICDGQLMLEKDDDGNKIEVDKLVWESSGGSGTLRMQDGRSVRINDNATLAELRDIAVKANIEHNIPTETDRVERMKSEICINRAERSSAKDVESVADNVSRVESKSTLAPLAETAKSLDSRMRNIVSTDRIESMTNMVSTSRMRNMVSSDRVESMTNLVSTKRAEACSAVSTKRAEVCSAMYDFHARRQAGEFPLLTYVQQRAEMGQGHIFAARDAMRERIYEQMRQRNNPGFKLFQIPDKFLSSDEFDSYCKTFQWYWENISMGVLETVMTAVKTPGNDPYDCLEFLQTLSEQGQKNAPYFEPKGLTQLLATLYSFEGSDVDSLAGFKEEVNQSPYVIMNVAARLLSGEQRRNPKWPKDAAEAKEPFSTWVKTLAYISASSIDFKSWVRNLTPKAIDEEIRKMVERGADANLVKSGFKVLTEGLSAIPEIASLGNQPALGDAPCLFSGISLGWDKDKNTWNMWKMIKPGSSLCFCGLRSMTPCISVAIGFLDKSTEQNVLICIEGMERCLPVWHCSAYPNEMEALVPCLTKCEVICQPIDAKKACKGPVFGKGEKFGFILLRARYTSFGMSDTFQKNVLAEGLEANQVLALKRA